jgi:hypothetical protein
MTSYDSGAAFDLKGEKIAEFKGGGDHFGNFFDAVKSRKSEDLHADILEGHLSSALCHLGNISYRLGTPVLADDAKSRLQSLPPQNEAPETFERFMTHLGENNVDLTKTKFNFGVPLTIDPLAEQFTGELAAQANPMLTREYRTPFVVPSKV